MTERPSGDNQPSLKPFELPSELVELMRNDEMAFFMQATTEGTAFIAKLPSEEIESVRGTVPIGLTHELLSHPQAPVIRTLMHIFDQPAFPLVLETFTNIADEQQAADFTALAGQDRFLVLFYDSQVEHRLTKSVFQQPDPNVRRIIDYARKIQAMIPAERYDFDEAKRAVVRTRRL